MINDDVFSCQICLELFYKDEDKFAVALECGHTICKKCLKDILKTGRNQCPIDNQTEISLPNEYNYIENYIIRKAVILTRNLNINFKSLTKLYFYYCSKCDKFLSSSSAEIHKVINHNITTINSYANIWLDYIYQNIASKKITVMIKLFIVLYFFQSPYITKIQKYNFNERINYNENKFNFYGEKIEKNKENEKLYVILTSILSNNNFSDNYYLKKGILIGENYQVIHGYFMTYSGNKNIIIKGLGITNCEGTTYFGLINFSKNPISTGFFLDVGILDDGITYYFGKFSDNQLEYPSYELEIGEHIIETEEGFEVELINKKNKDKPESFNNNKFFSIQKAGDKNIKVQLSSDTINSNNSTQIDIIMEKDNFDIKSIELTHPNGTNGENNDIVITKRIPQQVQELYLYDSKIFLEKYKFYIIFDKEIDYFILTDSFTNDKPFYGYYIFPHKENVCALRFYEIKQIIAEIDNFTESIQNILSLSLKKCNVFYQKFNPLNNFEKSKTENYIEFNALKNCIMTRNGKTNVVISRMPNDELQNMCITDIFSEYFTEKINLINMKSRKIACRCNIF